VSVPKPAIVQEDEVRALVGPAEALAAMRKAFAALDRGDVILPAILDLEFEEAGGEAHVKGGWIRGDDTFAVKVATGFSGNADRGLPTTSGLFLVLSATTGFVETVLLDNGYLTELRTGAAGALAADLLSRPDIDTALIFGAGGQARYQLEGLLGVRSPRRILVVARRQAQAEAYAREMRKRHEVDVEAAEDLERAVRAAELIVTTTPSREALFPADWLEPGTHVTAMGSDFPEKQELDPVSLTRADLVVVDDPVSAARHGELHHALGAGAVSLEDVVPLGAIVNGRHPGRQRDDEITICDLVGIGVQDAAIAAAVRALASAGGR
jgi:ornithine cyclodeaminase/alanine dehydrogenase-like protein (mu-crystallin family)